MFKKRLFFTLFLGFLVCGILFVQENNNVEAAACKNINISIYSMNKNTKEATFKITGRPGNKVQFAISEPLATNGYKYTTYFNMPSSGVKYVTHKFPASGGGFRAYVYQYHPCSANDSVMIFM